MAYVAPASGKNAAGGWNSVGGSWKAAMAPHVYVPSGGSSAGGGMRSGVSSATRPAVRASGGSVSSGTMPAGVMNMALFDSVGANKSSAWNALTQQQAQTQGDILSSDPSIAANQNFWAQVAQYNAKPTGFEQQFKQQQFDAGQANRSQMLSLLGFTPETLGQGGLLGSNFFGSILGNPVSDVVGGITGSLGLGGGGGGGLSQPGFADSPGATGTPGGGGGSGLFNQQIQGRGAIGKQIMNLLGGFGDSERARISRDQQNLGNTALAHLEARGLGSTNLAGGEMARAARFGAEQRGQLEDRLIGQRVDALQGIGEGLFKDVGSEMDRGVERQRIGANLLNALLGSAFNTVSL